MKRADVAAFAGLVLALAGAYAWYEPSSRLDSDRHFHHAISHFASAWGYLRSVPQAEDTGWAERFPDKEYLFHVVSTWGLRLGGEAGFRLSSLLWAALASAALYVLCRLTQSPAFAFAWTIAVGLASGYWGYRLMLFRPLVLAIAAALWLCVGLLTHRRWLAGLAAAVFILGYHAVYVPILILGLFVGAHRSDKGVWRTALAGVAGLALGIVLNPYFPSTAQATIAQILVAFTATSAKGVGVEVLPLTTAEFLRAFAGPLAAVLLCIARPWVFPPQDSGGRRRMAFLISAALVFWGLALWTPRAAEYAIPFSAIALSHGLGDLSRRTRLAAAGLVVVLQVPSHLRDRQRTPSDDYALAVTPALEHLPPNASGKKVLNCAYDEGSTLLDLRPDLRFVDAMDPMGLKIHAPQLSRAREELQEGRTADAWWIAHSLFHAQYVVCGYPAAIEAMDSDPRFERIYPPLGAPPAGPHHDLFAVRETALPAVRRFEVIGEHGPLGELRLGPEQVYLDLQTSKAPRSPDGCMRMRPHWDSSKLAEVALLGGGPGVSLQAAGRVLFQADPALGHARWNSVLVPLPNEPGSLADLTLEVCPRVGAPFLGASLSFWSWDEIRHLCGATTPGSSAQSTGVERRTCLGPVALPADSPLSH